MAQPSFRLPALFAACALGLSSVALAQAGPTTPAPKGAGAAATSKTSSKKSVKAPGTDLSTLGGESQAEKAARLAEGRRKFFEQSSGFENKNNGMPLSLGAGGTPQMGLHF